MTKKIKKNKLNIIMSIKFKCEKCVFERLLYQSEFKKMKQETFKNNILFICDNCKIRINPISVEADF